ncbi:MAG: citrate lyase subunit alpha, partial [Clostridia bacterium]
MKLAPSSIFPSNAILVDLMKNGNVTEIYTDYVNGPVAEAISHGQLKGMCVMHTHGGRPQAIESGALSIDVAILAAPSV